MKKILYWQLRAFKEFWKKKLCQICWKILGDICLWITRLILTSLIILTASLVLPSFLKHIANRRFMYTTTFVSLPTRKPGSNHQLYTLKVYSHLTSFSPFYWYFKTGRFFCLTLCKWWRAKKQTEWVVNPFLNTMLKKKGPFNIDKTG